MRYVFYFGLGVKNTEVPEYGMAYLFNCVTDGNKRVQTTEGKM